MYKRARTIFKLSNNSHEIAARRYKISTKRCHLATSGFAFYLEDINRSQLYIQALYAKKLKI